MSTENTSIAVKEPKAVRDFLALPSYKSRFEEVLGKRAPQFMASVSNLTASPALARANPKSVIAAAFVAATLDLPIDKNLGFAWVVPYGTEAQFQLGFRGFIQLGLRTGQYKAINDCVIPEGVLESFDPLTGDLKLDWSKKKSDKIVGYAVFFRLLNGFEKTVYWPREKVEAHARRYSKAFNSGPWKDNFDAMALKTVIKYALGRYGILSVELQNAMKHDAGSQKDIEAPVEHLDSTVVDIESEAVAAAPEVKKPLFEKKAEKVAVATPATPESLEANPPPEVKGIDKQHLIDELEGLMLDLSWTEKKVLELLKTKAGSIAELTQGQLQLAIDLAKKANQPQA